MISGHEEGGMAQPGLLGTHHTATDRRHSHDYITHVRGGGGMSTISLIDASNISLAFASSIMVILGRPLIVESKKVPRLPRA